MEKSMPMTSNEDFEALLADRKVMPMQHEPV